MKTNQTQQTDEIVNDGEYTCKDMMNHADMVDGTRFSWNVWPSETVKNGSVPIACLYNVKQPCHQVEQESVLCVKCQSAINPFTYFDQNSNSWTCCFCQARNPLPRDVDPTFLMENIAGASTIEYVTGKTSAFPPVFFFIIDTSTYDAERHEMMKRTVAQTLEELPNDALIGILTYGTNINVHSFGSEPLKTIYQFSGDFTYTKKNVRGMEDLRMFLVKKGEKGEEIMDLVKNLRKDPFPVLDGMKPNRCTGAAISFAMSFLEGPFLDSPVKYLLFTQGPCTYGPGMTSLKEVSTDEKIDLEKAAEFYRDQAIRLNDMGHSIDIYGETIADIGFEQMRPLTTLGGGAVLFAQDFEERIITKSVEKLFCKDEKGVLNIGFTPRIVVKTSSNTVLKSILGSGKQKGSRWKGGSIQPEDCIAFLFEPNDKTRANEYAYVQFKTTYFRSDRTLVTKITTFAKLYSNDKVQQASNFDEEAACIAQARVFCLLPFENVFDLETAIDKHLIRFTKRNASWERNNIDSINLPINMQYYMNFMFFFRRSFVIQKDGISLDESAYFKTLLFKLKPSDSIKLIKPHLFSYSYSGDVASVELSTEALNDDVILVLDSFHNVVQWQGINIVNWIKEGLQEHKDYAFFKTALELVEQDCATMLENRVPVPQYKKTAAGKSQERILMTYLCLSGGISNKTQKIDYNRFYSALCKHIVSND